MTEDEPFWEGPPASPEGMSHPDQMEKSLTEFLGVMKAAFSFAVGDELPRPGTDARKLFEGAEQATLALFANLIGSYRQLYNEKHGGDPRGS